MEEQPPNKQEEQEIEEAEQSREILKVIDNRIGMTILLGSTSLRVDQLAELSLQLKSKWGKPKKKKTNAEYLG